MNRKNTDFNIDSYLNPTSKNTHTHREKTWSFETKEEKQSALKIQSKTNKQLEENQLKREIASIEKYKATFLNPPRITDRKTVYLSCGTRDKLDEIVRRLGIRGSSVSGFIENMAREHLKRYEDKITRWKKL